MMLGRLSLDPTPFDSESFLTLTTLAHPDLTMTLPIILGILTMANVESSNWVMNAAERERERQMEERAVKRVGVDGQLQIKPKSLIRSGLRLLSVGRIIIAAMAPGVSCPTSFLSPSIDKLSRHRVSHSTGSLLPRLVLCRRGLWTGRIFGEDDQMRHSGRAPRHPRHGAYLVHSIPPAE